MSVPEFLSLGGNGSLPGEGISEIEHLTNLVFGGIIFIQAILVFIELFRNTLVYNIVLRYYVIIPLALSILCLQHEVQHYTQGSLLILLSVVSVILSFRKPR